MIILGKICMWLFGFFFWSFFYRWLVFPSVCNKKHKKDICSKCKIWHCKNYDNKCIDNCKDFKFKPKFFI